MASKLYSNLSRIWDDEKPRLHRRNVATNVLKQILWLTNGRKIGTEIGACGRYNQTYYVMEFLKYKWQKEIMTDYWFKWEVQVTELPADIVNITINFW